MAAANSTVAAVAIACSSSFLFPASVIASELQASIAHGGRLYDDWIAETREHAPDRIHPSYPPDGKFAADAHATWRCQECHGWDYLGRDGAYGKGDHATGIKGIHGMAGAAPEEIIAVLKDGNHAYGGLMGESDFRDLANFVSTGQVDMDEYIERTAKSARGRPSNRQDYYLSICAQCHGRDGSALATIPPLGDVARENPWAALHKILNGHPAEQMPPLRVLGRQVLSDILAFVQSLPGREVVSSIVRGGRLYDNWRAEIGGYLRSNSSRDFPPNKRHRAYPLDGKFARQPLTNWRCKECHGWDYRGRDGVYGAGPHFTGIKGIRGMAGADPDAVIAILKDGNHQFGKILSFRDFHDLANFVTRGQIDMDEYITRQTGASEGSRARHKAYYTTICASCHGVDGRQVITISPLGRIARSNPWEVLHNIANGHPDESMPALRVLGMQTLADILAYVQTLPQTR